MKVGELITALKKYDPKKEVLIVTSTDGRAVVANYPMVSDVETSKNPQFEDKVLLIRQI